MSIIKIYDESELGAPSKKDILRYARANDTDTLNSLTQHAVNELSGTLTPRVCYAEAPVRISENDVDLGFCRIRSNSLSKALSGCNTAIVFAATVGMSADRLIAKYSRLSPTDALFIQAVGTERIEALCDLFEDRIKKELASIGKATSKRFSPGYGDLPLELQKDIFALLSPERIGISLGETLLMTPTKSVTAIIGIKDETK